MFDHNNFFGGILDLMRHLLYIYMWIVLIRVLVSWFNPDPLNPIVQFLRSVTDPPLDALRSKLPRFLYSSGLDFTPLIFIVLIQIIMMFLESIHI